MLHLPKLHGSGTLVSFGAALGCAALVNASLSGCLGAAAAKFGARADLCANVTHVESLKMTRLPTMNRERFSFPARVTVSSARQAQRVAQSLCALPPMPMGAIHCPADIGINYQLQFGVEDIKVAPVRIGASGCEVAVGLGAPRWIANSPSFWVVLGHAAGINHPSVRTFMGTIA